MKERNREFGMLTRVSLRDGWKHEATDFTRWLVDNIDLLGKKIGMDLVVEKREKEIGPYRADIVCTADDGDRKVLIENQLEKTDHKHLGQLLTYASGIDASAVVWVADKFVEQHRAALDWLNEKTNENINFFGVEAELLQIDSYPKKAPNFNVVVKPNQWVKGGAIGEMTGKRPHSGFWDTFTEMMEEYPEQLTPTAPGRIGMGFSTGFGGIRLYVRISGQKRRIGVRIRFKNKAAAYYPLLKESKEEIEKEVGANLEWKDAPENGAAYISMWLENQDPNCESDWVVQHDWLRKNLYVFYDAFCTRVKALDREG